MRINWRLLFGILISVAALAFIVKDATLADLTAALTKANYWWLLPSGAVIALSLWVRAVRWRVLLDDGLPLRRAFDITNVANFLNNVLPFRLGELGKAYLASRNSAVTTMQGLSTVLIERLLDVLSVFGMLLIVLPLVPRDAPNEELILRAGQLLAASAFIGIIGLFVVAAWREKVLALTRRLTPWLPANFKELLLARADDFLRGVSAASGKRLIWAIFWSVIAWLASGVASYTMLLMFVPQPAFYVGIFVMCALALGLSIPSAPSGAGLYEGAAIAGLAVFGISKDTALAYGIVSHLFTFLIVALLGVTGLDREGESLGHLATAAQNMLAATRNK